MMIEPKVKKFIESNISYVEKDNWVGFFNSMVYSSLDYNDAQECVKLLTDVGFQFDDEARQRALRNELEECIDENYDSGNECITVREMMTSGWCLVGYPLDRLFELVPKLISNYGPVQDIFITQTEDGKDDIAITRSV